MSVANLQNYQTMDGHKLLFEYRRDLKPSLDFIAGFSLSRSINEVMSDDPEVVDNPQKIREGYNGSSLDFFIGFNFDLLTDSNFSLPIGFGITPRLRTESYPDPEGEIDVELLRIDENDERIYAVMTETIYIESYDLGFYGNISAGYHILDNWEINLQSRYQIYTEGFSVFSAGTGVRYLF